MIAKTMGSIMNNKIMNKKVAGTVSANEAMKNIGGAGNLLNIGFGVWTGMDVYNEARAEGKNFAGAAAEGALLGTAFNMIGLKTGLALGAGYLGYAGVKTAITTGYNNDKNYQRAGTAAPFSNGTFVDSQQAYTMRQAGATMIQQNAMNTKKAIMGNEAMYMHR